MTLRLARLALASFAFAMLCVTAGISLAVPASPLPQPQAAPQPSAAPPPSPPASSAPNSQIAVPGSPDKSFVQAGKEALPTLIGAILLAFLGWAIGLRLTAAWDLRKKRQELDIAAITDFNRVVAEFKAIGREREPLIDRRATDGADGIAALRDLHKRAIAAESSLEVILLKLLVDSDAWLAAHDANRRKQEQAHQIHIFALFRLIFRTMRENVMTVGARTPGFSDAELWLFNRLAAEVAGIIYERAANPAVPPLWQPWKITAAIARPDPTAYLKLVSYRTTDLRQAIAVINPVLQDYSKARNNARTNSRRANIGTLFDPAKTSLLEDPDLANATPGPNITTVVQLLRPFADEHVPAGLDDLFARHPNLVFYLAVTDQPPRIKLNQRDAESRILTELDALPESLPFAQPGLPRFGIDILRWVPDQQVEIALERVAKAPLGFNPPGAPDPVPLRSAFPALEGYAERNAVSPPP